jgi:hypothetical protein
MRRIPQERRIRVDPKAGRSSFRANALNNRRIVGAGNPARFAPTTWWWTQSREAGLHVPNSLVTGKKQGKSLQIGLDQQNLLPTIAVLSATCAEYSLRARTGNSFLVSRESFFAEQGSEQRFQRIYSDAGASNEWRPQSGVAFVSIGLCCVEGEQGDCVAVALT